MQTPQSHSHRAPRRHRLKARGRLVSPPQRELQEVVARMLLLPQGGRQRSSPRSFRADLELETEGAEDSVDCHV
jgi:hypothetical protein